MPPIFRTHVMGIDDSGKFRDCLPPFDEVLAEIHMLNEIAKAGGVDGIDAEVRGPDGGMIQLKDHSKPVRYNVILPRLFSWSYFVLPEDVPDEFEGEKVVEGVIFALKTLHKMLEEESDDTLRLLVYLDDQHGEAAREHRNVLFLDTRAKLGYHLLRTSINRPAEASPYMHRFLEGHKELYAAMPEDEEEKVDHWMRYPNIWVDCGEASCLSGEYAEATITLERGLAGCKARPNQPGVDIYILRCHVHLALALDCLRSDSAAMNEHIDWAVRQLRKSPTRVITKARLEQYLQSPSKGRVHPVLAALGGKSWLKKAITRGVQSLKEEERSAKSCHGCNVRDVQKSLFRCARCQYYYYCSKDCQKADWAAHKRFCRNRCNFLKMLEAQKKENPVAAQKLADWSEWLLTPSTHRRDARISALGVHRDPSRGHTHILMEGIEYTPGASKDPRFKFTIVSAGVFRIDGVLESIESSLGLAPGSGRSHVQAHIAESTSQMDGVLPDGDCHIPMLILSMCSDIKPGSLRTQQGSSLALSNLIPYNPEWRKTINGTLGVVSDAMELRLQPDVRDAEKDFEEGSE